jgi:HD-like signal output (HDOD) protein
MIRMENTALAHLITNSKRIPTLTIQVRFLFQAFSDDTLGLSGLAKTLKYYPIISARLIGLANSAWFAPAMPINSIERACARLGMDIVRSVSIGLALISPFNVLSSVRLSR